MKNVFVCIRLWKLLLSAIDQLCYYDFTVRFDLLALSGYRRAWKIDLQALLYFSAQ